MLTLLLQLIGLLYVFVAPGLLLISQLESDWSTPVQLALGFALSALVVPIVCFCAAWLLGTNISAALVILVATGLNAGAGASWFVRSKRVTAGG